MQKIPWFDVNKLSIQVIEDDDGMLIRIDWDDTDPDLENWTSLKEEGQREFILTALSNACNKVLDDDFNEQL